MFITLLLRSNFHCLHAFNLTLNNCKITILIFFHHHNFLSLCFTMPWTTSNILQYSYQWPRPSAPHLSPQKRFESINLAYVNRGFEKGLLNTIPKGVGGTQLIIKRGWGGGLKALLTRNCRGLLWWVFF